VSLKADPLPTLVLLPGLACDDTVWQAQWPVLQGHARCWVPPPAVHHTIGAMAEAVLRDAPAERFALAGHSLGGRIALEVLRRAPQRVLRLALLDTGTHPRPAGATGEAERAQRMDLVDLARREGMRAMGLRWSPPMLHPSRVGTPVHDAVLAMIEAQSVERFAAQQQALLDRPDAAPLLPGIGCPTLVLCGREDSWSPPARHEEMAACIPGARLVLVDDCGHMCTMEQPAVLTGALLDWLHQTVT
jgi:pimeloyl-ACP methyl ester carboxylesterase